MKQKLRLESLEDRTTPAAFTPLALTADGALDSLRANVRSANTNDDTSNTFTLEAGTYKLTIENSDGQENAAAEGDLDLTAGKTYIFEGAGAGVTVLDGNTLDRVFQAFNGSTVILRNLTITGGLSQDNGEIGVLPGATGAFGGGILSYGSLTLENVTLTGNTAHGVSPDESEVTQVTPAITGAEGANGHDAKGGGVWQSGGALTLTNSVLTLNKAEGSAGNDGGDGGAGSEHVNGGAGGRGGKGGAGSGGGIYTQDAAVTLTTTTIQKNTVSAGAGGEGGQGGDIGGFRNNSADLQAGHGGRGGDGGIASGGGVYLANSTVTYSGTQISENTLAGGVGGLGGLGGKINGKDIEAALDGGIGGDGGNGGAAYGAGLYVTSESAVATLSGATIQANVGTAGAGGLGGGGGNVKAGGESSIDGGQGGVGGNGGEALGGGVYSQATSLILSATSTVTANQAKGGEGGEGGWGGDGTGMSSMHSSVSGENGGEGGNGGRCAAGGGLYLTSADLTLEAGTTVSSNQALGGQGGRGGDGGDALGTAIESSINGSEGGVGGNGGNAEGGGIYLSVGNLHVASSLVDANAVIAGNGGEGGLGGDAVAQDASTAEGSEGGDGGNGGNATGGGIYFQGTTFDLTASTVRSNKATAGAGGAGGKGGNADAPDSALATGVTGGDGGDGSIAQGGGIYSNARTTIITASTINANSVEGGKGGVGGNGGDGSNDDESGVRGGGGNAGTGSWGLGGGVLIQAGSFTLSNSTVSGNKATGGDGARGGAVGVGTTPSGESVVDGGDEGSGSSTGDGGDGGDGRGGGLYLNSSGTTNLLNSTIAANSSAGGKSGAAGDGGSGTAGEAGTSSGGNVDHVGKGVVKATSTIVSDGQATWGPDYFGAVTASASLIENATDATITAGAKPNLTGVDPRLSPLQNNGGPTATHGLLSDSPARDAGDNPANYVTDQRGPGFDRQIGDGVDIGAFEGTLAPPVPDIFTAAVGADANTVPRVAVYNTSTGAMLHSFFAYGLNFSGGVRVAVGDVNGDGVADVVTGAGLGGTAHVKVFSGKDWTELYSFYAYATNFKGGVYVGAADVNHDGKADIITGAGAGGGPHVKVFDGATGVEIQSFMAYGELFGGGVTVAGGDLDADGFAEIITGTASNGPPHVKAFSGVSGAEIRSFIAYGTGNGGVFVASNDLNDDGYADIITGQGQGAEPEVKAFSGKDGSELLSLMAFDDNFKGGVRVSSYTLSGKRFVTTAAGPTGGPRVRVFDAATLQEVSTFFAQTSNFPSGIFVA